MISSAETPAGGQAEELTHNLLTLEQGVLFANTNLGAVAAVSARDGHVQWISTYPRAKRSSSSGQDKRAAHFYRDLNPCVYHRGTLAVAPSDSEYILAFDATTGQMLWESHLAADAVHLLGVGGGNLIASGDHLWWIDVEGGKVMAKWPEQSPSGYGRGILAGDKIYWPLAIRCMFSTRQSAGRGRRRSFATRSCWRAKNGKPVVATWYRPGRHVDRNRQQAVRLWPTAWLCGHRRSSRKRARQTDEP